MEYHYETQNLYKDFKRLQLLLQLEKRKWIKKQTYRSQKKEDICKNDQKQSYSISIQICRSQYEKSLKKMNRLIGQKPIHIQRNCQNISCSLKQVKKKLFQAEKCLQTKQDILITQRAQIILEKLNNNIQFLIQSLKNILQKRATEKLKINNSQNQINSTNQLQKIEKGAFEIKRLANLFFQKQIQTQNSLPFFEKSPKANNDHNQYFRNLQIQVEKLKQKLNKKDQQQIQFQKELNNYKQIVKHKQQVIISLNLQISTLNLQLSQNKIQKKKYFNQNSVKNNKQQQEGQLLSHQHKKQSLQKRQNLNITAKTTTPMIEIEMPFNNVTTQKECRGINKQTNQQIASINKKRERITQKIENINENIENINENIENINEQIQLQQFVDYKSQIGGSDLSSIKGKQLHQTQDIDFQLQNNFKNFKLETNQNTFENQFKQIKGANQSKN